MPGSPTRRLGVLLLVAFACGPVPALGQESGPEERPGAVDPIDPPEDETVAGFEFDDAFGLSLEELMATEVSAVAGRSEALLGTPAAVTIITQEDMRRAGHTSVMEALRLVPGLQVSRISANVWAISARGFNSRFGDKLLVLVDGRAVYHDLFAGVYWDEIDLPTDEISHVEVVRGPGATIWGANAVNGVINIVTRETTGDEGGLVRATLGDEIGSGLEFRYGARAGENTSYRVSGKWLDHESFPLEAGGDAEDDWDQGRLGLRIDSTVGRDWDLFLQAHYYQGTSGTPQVVQSLTAPFTTQRFLEDEIIGGHALVALERGDDEDGWWRLQLYYDHAQRDNEDNGQIRRTVELDLRHRWSWGERHQLIAGVAYRSRHEDTDGSLTASFDPEHRTSDKPSAFIQDSIAFGPDWELMVGTKLEYNDYSGFEVQPAARVRWSPDDRRTTWAAISRAVRTPSRLDQDVIFTAAVIPGPVPVRILGDSDSDAEDLLAFEVGQRARFGDRWNVDLALFHFRYRDLITIGGPAPGPFDQTLTNTGDAETYGGEIEVTFDVTERWRLTGSYSYVAIDAHDGAVAESSDHADHQAQVRSQWRVWDDVDLNGAVYYVDAVPDGNIPSSLRLDLGLIWRPSEGLELALWGQNLTDPRHLEQIDEFLQGAPIEVPRGAYLQLSWEF